MGRWLRYPSTLQQVLASIGQLEFFYDQAPDVMRSCSMALQLLSVCIGSYLSGALVLGVAQGTAALDAAGGAGWLPEDLNDGRLDLFFLLLAGVTSHFLLFWVASGALIKNCMPLPASMYFCACLGVQSYCAHKATTLLPTPPNSSSYKRGVEVANVFHWIH